MQPELFPRAARLTALSLMVFLAGFALSLALMPDRAGHGLANLCHWDCGWYRSIAEAGYDVSPRENSLEANFGFYPGFPLAVRGVMTVSGLDFTAAAVLLNAIYTLLFVWLALSSREELLLRSDRDATVFVLAFLLVPLSLYDRVPYSEAQFNLALLATFVAWRRGAFVTAAIAGVVLTATRVTGVFLPVALLIELVIRERWRVLGLLAAPDGRFRALAVMPLGAIVFFVYLAFHVGDPLANFRVQSVAWDHPIGNPIDNLLEAITFPVLANVSGALAFLVAGGGFLFGIWRRRIPLPLALTGLGIVTMPTVTGLVGLPRYALALFVVFLVIPAVPKVLQWPLVGFFALLQIVMVVLWVGLD